MANWVTIYFGPRSEFDRIVHEETKDDDTVVSYLDSIRVYNARIKSSDLQTRDLQLNAPDHVDSCVVHADDFGSVLSHVIPSFASILESTYNIDKLYVQNPPKRAFDSLVASHDPEAVKVIRYKYKAVGKRDLPAICTSLEEGVLDQKEAKKHSSLRYTDFRSCMTNGHLPYCCMALLALERPRRRAVSPKPLGED